MKKIRIALFLVLITVNYLAGKCIEEASANEEASETLEKSEILSADALSSEGKADEVDTNEQISKTIERESREDSPNKHLDFADERVEFDDLSESIKTESYRKAKSTNDKVTNERKAEDPEKPNGESKSTESLEESEKSGKTEKQLEEIPDISKSVTENEEKKAEDFSEASAESKLSDKEMTSSPILESDRTEAKSGELREKPNDLGLDGIIASRRMFSKPNFIIDIKARSEENLSLEDKTAHVPTINDNNNFEFGSESRKLINRAHDHVTKTLTMPLKSSTPENRKVESPQILHNQNLPQFYPQSKLNLDFPVFDVQQYEPRGVPIYFELEQDQEKIKNNIIGAQSTQRCNTHCAPRQLHQSQRNLDSIRPLILNQLRNLGDENRNQDQQFHLNQRPINLYTAAENRYMENLSDNTKNPHQRFEVQGKINTKPLLDNNYFEDLSIESRVQIPLLHHIRTSILPIDFKRSLDNTNSDNLRHIPRNQDPLLKNPEKIALETKQFENLDKERNQLPQFHQAQKTINPNIMPSENKAFENLNHNIYPYPYPNFQLFTNPLSNILKTPAITYDSTSNNLKNIFQTLAEATGNPKKLVKQATKIQQTYPNTFNSINGGSSPYDSNYLSRFRY